MLHRPTQKKLPKKYSKPDDGEPPAVLKAANKPMIQQPVKSISNNNKKVEKVEAKVSKIQSNLNNGQLQAQLVQEMIKEIKQIKTELKEIKHQIGINEQPSRPMERRSRPQQQEEYEQNIENGFESRKQQQVSVQPIVMNYQPAKQQERQGHRQNQERYELAQNKKEMIDIGRIQPYMKEFKLDPCKYLMPYYHGYNKKSSKPVIIKYCQQSKSMEPIFNLYEKFWKNIVKAKNICINKVFDINEPLANYILVIEANKLSLQEMLNTLKIGSILVDLLKALQFFHDCGYLYRNIHPDHVMYSFDNNVTLIDFKNMRRFVDIKGKHLSISKDGTEFEDQFASNARIRGLKEGRKDDLESLGYLAIYMISNRLPWNAQNICQVRSKLTLKQLCGNNPSLLQYMAIVSQMATEETPNYQKLESCLAIL